MKTIDTPNAFKRLQQDLAEFAKERDWDQFHNPKNLVMALNGEVGELNELFQWLTTEQSENFPAEKQEALAHELADIQLYLLRLAEKCHIDLEAACDRKMALNRAKYPVEKCFGKALKYNEL
ncbi:nucleotide pyrophosphohydrolase [Enterovibrio sp. ZSDZ35]|uniref:Nucleotide pyrophosphohydrolase n=1 Tax=Enterovibrio qingdaonensis TaxID=2899818 RepID=A0ABT5QTI4_9GAMM|nr:nucleotide pyrophosphohydrolase [Enterovibrio sp. ZSDZ35]MDD1784287.1 nucleotide pyrophosphohydrolase [Enterovibrio sp. ZSDZ35]